MSKAEPIDPRVPWITSRTELDAAWRLTHAGARHREVVRQGARIGNALRDGPRLVSVRTLPLTTVLYPTKYAYNAACRVPVPFVSMTHRALLVQVRTGEGLKNVLFNPTFYEASLEAPFFRKLADRYGEWLATNVLTTRFGSVESGLATLGLSPADIDVVAFDHFHVQDLRPLFGVQGVAGEPDREGLFPRAVLLAPRCEWEDWDDLHPTQQAWFVRDGKRGIPASRVVLTHSDLQLGEGCLLLRTPGHTSGNQTLFCHADRGVFGCSENGCSVDNWAPHHSRIPGLTEVARAQELDLILNANTPDASIQYTSMALERSVVDRLSEAPAFFQMFPSSEVTPHWLSPGIRPTHLIKERDSGQLQPAAKVSLAASDQRKSAAL